MVRLGRDVVVSTKKEKAEKEMSDRFRKLEQDAFDVIVVGAGTGGLTTAALLASRGKKVLVCDRHYVAGGNATTFRRPGYEFDVGVHYIGDCGPNGVIPRILRAANINDIEFIDMDHDAFDILKFPDFDFPVSNNLEVYRDRLVDLFPKEARGIDRYIKMLREAWQLTQLPNQPWWKAAKTAWKSRLAVRYLMSTLNTFLDTCTQDPKLRAVFGGNQIIYTQPPSRVAAMVHIMGTMHYMQGPCYPKGGGQIISDKLADVVEQQGGKILLRTTVNKILVKNGSAVGVEIQNRHLGTRTIHAPIVVSNADIKHTMLELLAPKDIKKRSRRKTEAYEMSPALGVVYLGLRSEVPKEELPRSNYVVFPEYDVEPLYESVRKGKRYKKPWTCITVASVKDPEQEKLAPEGIINVQLMTVAPSSPSSWGVSEEQFLSGQYRKNDSYLAAKAEMTEQMLTQAEVVFPNLREQIDYREACTPLTHRRYTNATEGTSYGLALTPSQFFIRRPDTRTEIKNFYLCGASTRAGHGIPGVMLSGLGAAACALPGDLVKEVMGPSNDIPKVTYSLPKDSTDPLPS